MRGKIITATVAIVALAVTAVAAANPPLRFNSGGWSDSFQAPWLSEHCGVPVFIALEGKAFRGTLHTNQDGLVVREQWTMPSATITFYSPADEPGGTGLSFSVPDNAFEGTYTYPGGATVGGPATLRVTGLQGRVGNLIDAGQLVWDGVVIGFDDAIPLMTADWDNPVRVTGNRPAGSEWDEEQCAALGGTFTP